MVITLPLRAPVTLAGGVRAHDPAARGGGVARSCCVQSAYVRFGERARVSGRLVTDAGHPVAGATVLLLSRVGAEPEQLVETLTTDADGRFRSVVSGTSSRALRLVYAGSSVTLPTESALEHASARRHLGASESSAAAQRSVGDVQRPRPGLPCQPPASSSRSRSASPIAGRRSGPRGATQPEPGRAAIASSALAVSSATTSGSGCRRRAATPSRRACRARLWSK